MNLFARTIATLFLDAYAVVDSSAKASFEKVLGTWPNWNTQLFPKELIAKIEHGVRSMRQQKQGSYQPSPTHGKPHYSDRSCEDPYSQNAGNMVRSNNASINNLLHRVKEQRRYLLSHLVRHPFLFIILCGLSGKHRITDVAILVIQDQYGTSFGSHLDDDTDLDKSHNTGQHLTQQDSLRRTIHDCIFFACTAKACPPCQRMRCTASQIKKKERKRKKKIERC